MSTTAIQSPLPGLFYRRAAPDKAPFKQEGDAVAVGEVIGLIEVMKSFHEVTSGVDGSAIRFLADDGDAVMAGETLAEVDA